ncbi:unnamed protein product, partial [Brassica oleracea]
SAAHVLITSYSSPSSTQEEKSLCDYTKGRWWFDKGRWVRDEMGPLYSGSSCGTIKDGQNCLRHGRPDSGYLYWKWKPNQCDIPRFDANRFLDF